MTINETLRKLGACSEAREWAARVKPKTLYDAWRKCPRGDWLLWFAARVGVDRKALVMAACGCARLALPFWEAHDAEDRRPHVALETAEAWCRGEATIEEVQKAAGGAFDAASRAYGFYVSEAASAAVAAAYTAIDARYGARAARDALASRAPATSYAAAEVHLRCAKAVRKLIPWRAVRDAMKKMEEKA